MSSTHAVEERLGDGLGDQFTVDDGTPLKPIRGERGECGERVLRFLLRRSRVLGVSGRLCPVCVLGLHRMPGIRTDPVLKLQHLLFAQGGEAGTRRRDAGPFRQSAAIPLRVFERDRRVRPRDRDRAGEEIGGAGNRAKCENGRPSGGLTGYGHAAWVTAELGDVVADPLECEDPVQDSAVVRGVLDPSETVEAESVRNADRHDPVPVEGRAVIPRARGRPSHESATVDVDQYGQCGGIVSGSRGEDVHIERRLAGDRRLRNKRHLG